jgi:hypothetical protein
MLMRAFLRRPGVRISRSLVTVLITFETKLEAEEFHKLMASKKRA